jgi:hypothetical protein
MTNTGLILGALVEIQAMLIALAIYPLIFRRRSRR